MKILFMCVANSARSQLAEGLARRIFPTAHVESAGSDPGKLNSFAIKVMQEIGIDISLHFSKSVADLPSEFISSVDYVVTLCAEEVCPIVVAPNAERLHWPFLDPASKVPLPDAELIDRFRSARNAIQDKLEQFEKTII